MGTGMRQKRKQKKTDRQLQKKQAGTGIQLQQILKPRREICTVEGLYCHRHGAALLFDGYFNLFYIEKWKRYTTLERLYVSIRARGYRKLLLFHNRMCVAAHRLDAGCEKAYQAEFPLQDYKTGVFWFALVKETANAKEAAVRSVSGFYIGTCSHCQDVTIGVDICTFRREEYVERNLKLLQADIFQNQKLQVSGHVWAYLVDNGGTLGRCGTIRQMVRRSDGRIQVIPNRNTGGAGGFTRGMLEILQDRKERQLTHILLMDDDVRIEPDLFVRVYGFLRMRKEEWNLITLGGMMLREECRYTLHCAGEYWKKGIIKSPGRGLDLRNYRHAAGKKLLGTGKETAYYSGWWCCCYALQALMEQGLPLPVFLHHDDIEFGIRSQKYGIVFLNGVSVWHRSVPSNAPATNLYYDIRNNLIEIALSAPPWKAAYRMCRFVLARIAVRFVIYRPQEIIRVLQGCMDFLKGPKWLWEKDPQQIHHKIKQIPEYGRKQVWCASILIFGRFCAKAKKAVLDYQRNMYHYTTRQAWTDYLSR